jgi:hypothetical protein
LIDLEDDKDAKKILDGSGYEEGGEDEHKGG